MATSAEDRIARMRKRLASMRKGNAALRRDIAERKRNVASMKRRNEQMRTDIMRLNNARWQIGSAKRNAASSRGRGRLPGRNG